MAAETVVMDGRAIEEAVAGMADRVQGITGSGPLLLVGIRAGGDVLAERLALALEGRKVEVAGVGALDISLYRDDFGHRSHWPSLRASEIPFSIDEQTVLLVDDVLFTGRTIRAALDALLDYGRPARVLLAVLIDRGHRQLPVHADVVGRVVEADRDVLCDVRLASGREGGRREQVVLREPRE